jgi:hypothetical protein
MVQLRRHFTFGLFMVLAALVAPVANAQTHATSAQAPRMKFYWCWAATLRPDTRNGSPGQNKVWYSAVFSGDFPIARVKSAFRANIDKDYHDDVMATGVGPGECGSYDSRAAAESSKNQNVTWRRDDNGMQVVETGWSYGEATLSCGNGQCRMCFSDSASQFSPVFKSSASNDQILSDWMRWLSQKWPTHSFSPASEKCVSFATAQEAQEALNNNLKFWQQPPANWLPPSGVKVAPK